MNVLQRLTQRLRAGLHAAVFGDMHHQHAKVLRLEVRTLCGVALQAVGLVARIGVAAIADVQFMVQSLLAGVNLLLNLAGL